VLIESPISARSIPPFVVTMRTSPSASESAGSGAVVAAPEAGAWAAEVVSIAADDSPPPCASLPPAHPSVAPSDSAGISHLNRFDM
jgi:hypothetical protein